VNDVTDDADQGECSRDHSQSATRSQIRDHSTRVFSIFMTYVRRGAGRTTRTTSIAQLKYLQNAICLSD